MRYPRIAARRPVRLPRHIQEINDAVAYSAKAAGLPLDQALYTYKEDDGVWYVGPNTERLAPYTLCYIPFKRHWELIEHFAGETIAEFSQVEAYRFARNFYQQEDVEYETVESPYDVDVVEGSVRRRPATRMASLRILRQRRLRRS